MAPTINLKRFPARQMPNFKNFYSSASSLRKNVAEATRGQAEPAPEKNADKNKPLNQITKGLRGPPKTLAETIGHHVRNFRSHVKKHASRLKLPAPKSGALDFFDGSHNKSNPPLRTTAGKTTEVDKRVA